MATPKVDLLLDLKNLFAAYNAALSGEWEEKITTVNQSIADAHAAWDALAAGQTLLDLQKNTQSQVDTVQAQIEAIKADAQTQVDAAATATQVTKDFAAQTQVDRMQLVSDQAAFASVKVAAEANLATRVSMQIAAEEDYQVRLSALAAAETEVNTQSAIIANKLAVLKSIE